MKERYKTFAYAARVRIDSPRAETVRERKEEGRYVAYRFLSTGWRQFLTALQPDHRQRLLEVLRDEDIDEAKDVVQFEEHARRMTYPHFRERLLRIAEEEKAHVKWLQDKIQALGGEIPQTTVTVKNGKNSWESL